MLPPALTFRSQGAWLAVTGIVLFMLHIGWMILVAHPPSLSYVLPNSTVAPESGFAFVVPIPSQMRTGYMLPTDTNERPDGSWLTVFEDGRPLGPAHSLHSDIRAKGGGRFSHWGQSLLFSSSDGSDPRLNGRAYSVVSEAKMKREFKVLLLTSLLVADLLFLVAGRRTLAQSRGVVAAFLASMAIATAALASFGAFGKLYLAIGRLPADWALLGLIALHLCLGCIVTVGTWGAGAGVVRLFSHQRNPSVADILIPAYPASLVVLAALVATSLLVPQGGIVSLVLWGLLLLPLVGWRPPRGQLRALVKVACLVLPLACAFGAWLAVLWHGPTSTLPGSPSGDLTSYASITWTLADQAWPFADRAYELAGPRGYFNTLYPALGAALINLPHFDAFLFLLASGGVTFVLLTAVMLHLLLSSYGPSRSGALRALILAATFVAAIRYPYWISESIPVIFVPALTLSVWWMAQRAKERADWSIAAMLAGLIGSILSKVVIAPILVLIAARQLVRHYRSVSPRIRIVMAGIAIIGAVYCSAMLWHFLPLFLFSKDVILGPESAIFSGLPYALRDAGLVFLIVAAWTLFDYGIAAVLTLALVTVLIYSFVFQINFIVATILIGVGAATKERIAGKEAAVVLAALALCIPAATLTDPAGLSSGLVWLICVGGSVTLVSLVSSSADPAKPRFSPRVLSLSRYSAMALGAIIVIGIGNGSLIASSGWQGALNVQLRDVWLSVRKFTPRNSLIFTDQVDDTPSLTGGWNTYAVIGQRQIFLSSYYTNFELRASPTKLHDVLRINRAVLDGSKDPMEVATRARYNEVFGVVTSGRASPAGWSKLYDNGTYSIFRIR